MPARLDRRVRSGTEVSVELAPEPNTCYGRTRDAAGHWYEPRGTLTDRRAFPGDTDPTATRTFSGASAGTRTSSSRST
ncbi:hypothetical protein ACIQBJ_05115 [Kitasatospora sp. NPDC088391]|uniref:hypothetical protein n=1 Tax=Kitasatospora sp. NPDC088391 TaxID=3364074 RepID=UPI003807D685